MRFPYRAVTRIALGIGLLAFVLPFASVSCGGQHLFDAKGVNTVVGGQYSFGGEDKYYAGDPYFLVAVIGAVLALAAQFLRPYVRVRLIAGTIAGLASVAGMASGPGHVSAQITPLETNGLVTIRWEAGYWIALVAFGVGAIVAVVQVYRTVRAPSVPGLAAARTPPSTAALAGGLMALMAAPVIIAACTIPYLHYKVTPGAPFDSTSSPSVFNPGFGPANWFAAQPVAVAVLTLLAGAVLLESTHSIRRAIAAGALVAYGVQTIFFFVGYVALAIGSPDSQLQPGGFVGAFGGVLLLVGGLLGLGLSRESPRQAIAIVRSWAS